ncbi:uncharacterized protein EI97DRAFT_483256, partial [Westerdykella ornata]
TLSRSSVVPLLTPALHQLLNSPRSGRNNSSQTNICRSGPLGMSFSFVNSRIFPRSRSLANLSASFSARAPPYTHAAGARTEAVLNEVPDDSITALPPHPMVGQSGEQRVKSERDGSERQEKKKLTKENKEGRKGKKDRKEKREGERKDKKEKEKKSKAKAAHPSKWARIKSSLSTTWKRLSARKPAAETGGLIIGAPTDFVHVGGIETLAGGVVGGGGGIEERESDWEDVSDEE